MKNLIPKCWTPSLKPTNSLFGMMGRAGGGDETIGYLSLMNWSYLGMEKPLRFCAAQQSISCSFVPMMTGTSFPPPSNKNSSTGAGMT